MCRWVAYYQIFEKVLVRLIEYGEREYWEIYVCWIEVIEGFIRNWHELIREMCENLPEILWGLVADHRN